MAKKATSVITVAGIELPVEEGIHSILELDQETDPAQGNGGRRSNPEDNPFYGLLIQTVETGKSARVLVTPETCKTALRLIEKAATAVNRQLKNQNEKLITRKFRFRPADNPEGPAIDLGRHSVEYIKRDGTTGVKRVLNDPTEPVYIEFWARDRDDDDDTTEQEQQDVA